jgi:DNA-binding CsgD family transcriptional regulator
VSVDKNGRLSPRQAEILRLISRGKTDKEIAVDLTISRGTVKTHLRIIFSKLRARSRAQAVFRWHD